MTKDPIPNDVQDEETAAEAEEDFFSFDIKNDVERDDAIRRFELEMARLLGAFHELPNPTAEDEDRLSETKTELRRQLIVDILSTVSASTEKNSWTYHRNLMHGAILDTYMVQRIANDLVEEFQLKLNRRDQADGKPVNEFAKFESTNFIKYVRLICDIKTVDTLCNAAGYGVVTSARDKIIDNMIAHYFTVRNRPREP